MNKKKEPKIELITTTNNLKNKLEIYKENVKYYNKLLSFLMIMGTFEDKPTIDLYDYDKLNNRTRAYTYDLNDNIYIFSISSDKKSDLSIINIITNDKEYKYDLAILKKCNLTKENINLCMIDKIYDTKYGRLITDNKSFYTFIFRNGVTYQIVMENDIELYTQNIIDEVNLSKNIPNLKDLITIFEQELPYNYNNQINISSYINNECISSIYVNSINDSKKLIKK